MDMKMLGKWAMRALFIPVLLATFFIGRITAPEDRSFRVNLSDPLVKRAGLLIPGVDKYNIAQLPVRRRNFITKSGDIECVSFFPVKGVGRIDSFCFLAKTGQYIGESNLHIAKKEVR